MPKPIEPDSAQHNEHPKPVWKTHLESTVQTTWRETRRVAIVTFLHLQHLTTSLWIEGRRQFCLWRLDRTKLVLGEKLHRGGLGDKALNEEISELDDSIQLAKAENKSIKESARSRRTLIARLADSASDFSTAESEELGTLQRELASIEDTRRQLEESPSTTQDDRTRIGFGCGAIMLLAVLGFGWAMSGSSRETLVARDEPEVLGVGVAEALSLGERSEIDELRGNEYPSSIRTPKNSSDPSLPPIPNDNPATDLPLYTPQVISRPHGSNQIVTTVKMPLVDGLFLTISFFVIDPNDPNARKLDGVAGIVMLENLVSIRDFNLTRRTRLRIGRGALPAFEVNSPQEKWINDGLKALDYGGYSPPNLLFYLRGEGRIIVEVDGESYTLGTMWRDHLNDVLEETLLQKRRMGY